LYELPHRREEVAIEGQAKDSGKFTQRQWEEIQAARRRIGIEEQTKTRPFIDEKDEDNQYKFVFGERKRKRKLQRWNERG